MKRYIIAFVAGCCIFAAMAQQSPGGISGDGNPTAITKKRLMTTGITPGYQGFVEINAGYGIYGAMKVETADMSINNISNALMFGISTTHGWRITRNLYVGAGFGVYGEMLRAQLESEPEEVVRAKFYAVDIPVYADFRWDFDVPCKGSPFIDVKIGYQFIRSSNPSATLFYKEDYFSCATISLMSKNTDYLFLRPTIGFRIPFAAGQGFNFGLAYDVFTPKKIVAVSRDNAGNAIRNVMTGHSGGAITIMLGLDF